MSNVVRHVTSRMRYAVEGTTWGTDEIWVWVRQLRASAPVAMTMSSFIKFFQAEGIEHEHKRKPRVVPEPGFSVPNVLVNECNGRRYEYVGHEVDDEGTYVLTKPLGGKRVTRWILANFQDQFRAEDIEREAARVEVLEWRELAQQEERLLVARRTYDELDELARRHGFTTNIVDTIEVDCGVTLIGKHLRYWFEAQFRVSERTGYWVFHKATLHNGLRPHRLPGLRATRSWIATFPLS